jgi:hypothetical protein
MRKQFVILSEKIALIVPALAAQGIKIAKKRKFLLFIMLT